MKAHSVWNEAHDAEIGIVGYRGSEYTAQGARVTDARIAAYPHEDGTLRAWDGSRLGTWRTISRRKAVFFGHVSWQGDWYYYMRARLQDGREYALRGFGPGMVAAGRRIGAHLEDD